MTDELVDVLLTPLLSEGAADVVFDTLSYSAGPLPEPLLQDERLTAPVHICFGEEDPWTPPARVLALERFNSVRGVTMLPGVGHCPHDGALRADDEVADELPSPWPPSRTCCVTHRLLFVSPWRTSLRDRCGRCGRCFRPVPPHTVRVLHTPWPRPRLRDAPNPPNPAEIPKPLRLPV